MDDIDLLRLVAVTPPELDEVGMQRLQAAVVARVSKRRRRPFVRILAAAAMLGVLGAITWAGASLVRPEPALATPIAFREKDGYITAIITDPAASKAEFDATFKQHGFDISVVLVPLSPGGVGTIPSMGEDSDAQRHEIKLVRSTDCWTPGGGQSCARGMLIPKDFVGHAVVNIGRPAAPGEMYRLQTNAFFPGEVLNCSGLAGMTVSQATPVLQGLGLRAVWRSADRSIDNVKGIDPATIENQFVMWDASPASSDTVWVWVSPTPPTSDNAFADSQAGC